MALRSTDDDATGGSPSPERPTVAAFDFDGTLTDSGSVFPFLVSLRGTWPVLRAVARLSPELVRAAVTGGHAADHVKEKLFMRLLGGLPIDEVDGRSAVFAHRHLQRHLRDDTLRRLEWHRRQGHHIVVVSASPECYVLPAGGGARRPRGRRHPAGRRRGRAADRRLRGQELPGGGEVRRPRRLPPLAGPAVERRRRAADPVGLRQQPRRPAAAQRGRPRRRRRPARPARSAAPVPPALRASRRQPGVAAMPTAWPE